MKKNIVKLLVLAIAVMSVMLAFASCGCSHEEETIPAVAATCTEAGATEGTKCKLCGEVLVAPVPTEATGHNYQSVDKVDATCTTDGYEAGSKCACGAIESGCEVIAAAHKPADVAEQAATCTTDGVAAGKRCTVCAENLEGFEVIPATGHTLEDVEAIAPSCTVAGCAAGKQCSACDYSEGFDTVPATGHTAKDVARVEPTCTEDGAEAGVRCKDCNEVMDGCAPIEKLGHTEGEITVVTAPALGVNGTGTSKCTVCNAALDVTIPGIPGDEWNYTSDTDVPVYDGKGMGNITQTLKQEGDRTYANYAYTQAGSGEWMLKFYPDVALGNLEHTNYIVFETDIKIDHLGPKADYATNKSSWFMYTAITDTEAAGDNDTLNRTWYVDENGTVSMNKRADAGGLVGPAQGEWFTLKITYCQDPANPKIVNVTYYINGEVFSSYEHTNEKNGTPYIQDPVVGFRFKFKNQSYFDTGVSLSLDNTKIYTEPSHNLTVKEAIDMGQTYAHNTFSEQKYTVTGEIVEIYNTQYGNMRIKDAEGNILTIYGTYSADGSTRFDALETKPSVGDTITITGIIGKYNSDSQVKNGWIVKNKAHAHAYVEGACTICGTAEPAPEAPAQ